MVTLPLAVVSLTEKEMGIYYLMLAINSLAGILDFGLASTISRNTSYAYAGASELKAVGVPIQSHAAPNMELLGAIISCSKGYYLAAASLLFAILGSVGSFIVFKSAEGALSSWLWSVYVFSTCYNLATMLWPYLLMGIGRVMEAARFGAALQVIQVGTVTIGLLGGAGLWAVALAPIIGALIIRPLTKSLFLGACGFTAEPVLNRKNMGLLKIMWPMAWRQGLTGLGGFLLQRGNFLIAGSVLGLAATAQYGFTTNTLSVIYQIGGIMLFVAVPHFSRLRVNGDFAELRRQFFLRSYFGLGIGLLGALTLLVFGGGLLHAIGANTCFLAMPLFIAFTVTAFFDAHTEAYVQLCLTGNANPFVVPILITGITQIIVSMTLLPKFGIWAFVISKLATEAPFMYWWSIKMGLTSSYSINQPAHKTS